MVFAVPTGRILDGFDEFKESFRFLCMLAANRMQKACILFNHIFGLNEYCTHELDMPMGSCHFSSKTNWNIKMEVQNVPTVL